MRTFLTQVGDLEGPQIEAFDFGHAQQQAWSEPGLEIVGELVLTIQRPGFTEEDADRICKALSEEKRIDKEEDG